MKKIIITFLSCLCIVSALGQSKADTELSLFLQKMKPDSYVYVKSGCKSCPIDYEDTLENKIDSVVIKLLVKKQDKQILAIFSDWDDMKKQEVQHTKIFEYIKENISVFKEKDSYYKIAMQAKFQAPCLVIFPYETINIKLSNFEFNHTLVEREMDNCGTDLEREKWFQKEIELLKMIDELFDFAHLTVL